MKISASICGVAMLVTACAPTAGTRPHDASVAAHEEEARRDDQLAAAHERDAEGKARGPNPNPEVTLLSGGATCPPSEFAVCWGGGTTDVHLAEADVHHRAAAAHRAASQALRDAERTACVEVAEADRDVSPFEHREAFASIEPRSDGAVVAFHAVPKLTQSRLQRLIDCHLARNAALGHDVPEMPRCPLVPNGVSGTVSSLNGLLVVTLRAGEPQTAREILRRLQQ